MKFLLCVCKFSLGHQYQAVKTIIIKTRHSLSTTIPRIMILTLKNAHAGQYKAIFSVCLVPQTVHSPLFSCIFYPQLLNAGKESQENWMLARNGRHDGVRAGILSTSLAPCTSLLMLPTPTCFAPCFCIEK